MWEYLKWICFIAAFNSLFKELKNKKAETFFKQLLKSQIDTFKQTFNEAYGFIKKIVNDPFYNKLSIGVNALFLLIISTYAALLFAVKVEEGHSVPLLLVCLMIFLGGSINFFYQNIKLCK